MEIDEKFWKMCVGKTENIVMLSPTNVIDYIVGQYTGLYR